MRSPQKPLACLWHATKIPSSSFWHLLYNNLHWKISKWSEIISWCSFAQSRLYAYLKKKPFPEITIICDQDDNSLSLCFKSMYRTLFVAIFTSDFIFSMFKSSHTYRNINISNLFRQTIWGDSWKKCTNATICNFASIYADDLRKHLKTPSGEKSFKCNQCDFPSVQAGDLRKHLKTPSGE